jgi:hypothetical protein
MWALTTDSGSLQHCGLGSFLLALVEHCATFVCTHPEASVFLKSNSSRLEFYENRGFASLPSGASLPHELLKIVPSANFATIESDDTSFCSRNHQWKSCVFVVMDRVTPTKNKQHIRRRGQKKQN